GLRPKSHLGHETKKICPIALSLCDVDNPLSRKTRKRSNTAEIDWHGISQDLGTNALISVNEHAGLIFYGKFPKILLCLSNPGFTYSALQTPSFVVKSGQTVALEIFWCN
ncbi:15064_t:CDS:2, partial [Gigaspora margarita]